MTLRRVVTGVNAEGKSCIVSDGPPTLHMVREGESGFDVSWIWVTEGLPQVPHDGSDPVPNLVDWFPGPTGSRLTVETLTPGFGVDGLRHEAVPPDEPVESLQLTEPDITFNARYADASGVHSSDTLDYAIVISGQLCLQMEDGTEVTLEQGDCVVQTGVRHTWRNRSQQRCRVAFIMLGAERSADPEGFSEPSRSSPTSGGGV